MTIPARLAPDRRRAVAAALLVTLCLAHAVAAEEPPPRLMTGRGMVSLGGAAFIALPVEVPARDVPVSLHVKLQGCDPFLVELSPREGGRALVCPPPTPIVVLHGPLTGELADVALEVRLRAGDSERAGIMRPGIPWTVNVPATTSAATLECSGPGLVPWARTINTVGVRGQVDVTCAPRPRGRFVVVQSPVAGLTWKVDQRTRADFHRLDGDDLSGLTLPHATTTEPEAGAWYALEIARDGGHQLCVEGPDHAELCLPFTTGPAVEPARLAPIPARRPAPPIRQETDPAPGATTIVNIGGDGPPGPLTFGLAGGLTQVHARTFGALGPWLRVRPENPLGISVEASLLFQSGERPVFLDRFESETRVTRGHVALRIDSAGDDVRAFAALGAFAEVEIALGPYVGAGFAFPVGPVDLEVGGGLPIYVEDRLGHAGLELLARLGYALPGGKK